MSFASQLSTLVPQLGATTATVKSAAQAVKSAAASIEDTAKDAAKRAKIGETAKTFEASFLSVMMQQMFEGVKTSEPFGGGNGEEMFKSMLTDAMSKQVTKAGGIGLAPTIQREMLKMQGLKE
ncbi:rod-binding protein [Caulobacter segnis]|jgi:Rod binding domain-containing protein|uniref:rod-binding protein n=1 Tax=Caulobacter segnis TaxID=88688 RepID=UPI001CBEA5F4|nr:rod-binding protein [Caulobacter segnis]UAL09415.1 rod-binding protein [Caulobacter segnis]